MVADVVVLSSPEGEASQVERVVRALAAGGVAVLPTDTVYGVAQAVGPNPRGPERVFAIKRRPAGKVVPWLVPAPEALAEYGEDVPAYAWRLARRFWPGGLTLVVRASDKVPAPYRAQDGSVALRVPGSPFVRAVASALGCALATTSANTSGAPAPASFAEVERRIVEESDVAVDGGPCPAGLASTIVSCLGGEPVVARRGAVGDEDVMEACR